MGYSLPTVWQARMDFPLTTVLTKPGISSSLLPVFLVICPQDPAHFSYLGHLPGLLQAAEFLITHLEQKG